MTKHNHEEIQSAAEKKAATRQQKKKTKMKISGRSIKQLQKLIISKSKKVNK